MTAIAPVELDNRKLCEYQRDVVLLQVYSYEVHEGQRSDTMRYRSINVFAKQPVLKGC